MPAEITPRPNGPLIVTGDFKIVDSDGNEFPVENQRAALCRCGGSTNKPFCSGTHRELGFADECKVAQQRGV